MSKIKMKTWLVAVGTFLMFLGLSTMKTEAFEPKVDTSGNITGIVGQKYYTVSSWKDMIDAHNDPRGFVPFRDDLYLLVTNDIAGGGILSQKDSQGNFSMSGVDIRNERNIIVLGSNKTLYYDTDTNYSTGLSRQVSTEVSNMSIFYIDRADSTKMIKLKDAKVVNNINGGPFKIGENAPNASLVYENVTAENGDPSYGGSMLFSYGKLVFKGNNTFNILAGHSTVPNMNIDTKDYNGEWVRGGHDLVVEDGKTVLNQNYVRDQPINYVQKRPVGKIEIKDNATLDWNLYFVFGFWYNPSVDNLKFVIGKNASWNISMGRIQNGRKQMFPGSGDPNINIDLKEGAKLKIVNEKDATTSWDKRTQITANKDSELSIINKGDINLFDIPEDNFNNITLNNPKYIEFITLGKGEIFKKTMPIFINSPLRTYASKTRSELGMVDEKTKIALDKDDPANNFYKREKAGITNTLFTYTGLITQYPGYQSIYTAEENAKIQNSKYLRWYQGGEVFAFSAIPKDRNYSAKIKDLPAKIDSSTDFLSTVNNEETNFVIRDERGENPNFQVTASVPNNSYGESVKMYWKNPNETPSELDSKEKKIFGATDDKNLPSYIQNYGAGLSYVASFKKDEGLLAKAKSSVKAGTGSITIRYTLADNIVP